MPEIAELRGLWRRSLIAWPDGRRDETTGVYWLQSDSLYADLRQPAGRPDFSHAACLNDLSHADCWWLAKQEGFTGMFSFDGVWFEWGRRIDYQPVSPYSDAGSLRWQGEILVEEGRDITYLEYWHREVAPLSPIAGLVLEDTASDIGGAFVRAGEDFMFVRDRAVALPALPSLAAAVATADPSQARDLIDCEISYGKIGPAGPRIHASSLPYRIGHVLGLHVQGAGLITTDQDANGRPTERRWQVMAHQGDCVDIQQASLVKGTTS
jgi:hypothetical protein